MLEDCFSYKEMSSAAKLKPIQVVRYNILITFFRSRSVLGWGLI